MARFLYYSCEVRFSMKNFIATIFIIFVPQIILVYLGKSYQIMIIFLVCSITVCVLFLQDKVNTLRFGKNGIELDMREAINEAYATIDNIKELIDPIINYNLQLMAGEDLAFEGTNLEERIAFFRKARELAKKLNIDTLELKSSFAKARGSVLYAFSLEVYDLWGHDTNGYNISKEIIETGLHSNKVHLDKFKYYIKELDDGRQVEARKLYDKLVDFLNETSDIDDSNY